MSQNHEEFYVTYEVTYKIKQKKRLHCAYTGVDKAVCDQVVRELHQREDLSYLAKSVRTSEVLLRN